MIYISSAILESIEALERLDITIAESRTIEALRQALLMEFGITDLSEINLSTKSLEKMQKIGGYIEKVLMPLGVTPFRVEYPSGKVITRFSIAGSRGAYGAEAVNEYLVSLED